MWKWIPGPPGRLRVGLPKGVYCAADTMSTPIRQGRGSRQGQERRAALLSLLACLGLILVQVRGSLHLVLESHCVAHEVGACGEWHGEDHAQHGHLDALANAQARGTHPAPASSDGTHCPYTLTDHPGQTGAKAPLRPHGPSLSGLAPGEFTLHTPCPPAVSGSQRPDFGPLRTLLERAATPRGPPCIV